MTRTTYRYFFGAVLLESDADAVPDVRTDAAIDAIPEPEPPGGLGIPSRE